MIRPTLINLNPVELKYYPFMISSEQFSGRKKKDIKVKAFNMITNKNEAKTMAKHILCHCKCKFNSKTCNSNQK